MVVLSKETIARPLASLTAVELRGTCEARGNYKLSHNQQFSRAFPTTVVTTTINDFEAKKCLNNYKWQLTKWEPVLHWLRFRVLPWIHLSKCQATIRTSLWASERHWRRDHSPLNIFVQLSRTRPIQCKLCDTVWGLEHFVLRSHGIVGSLPWAQGLWHTPVLLVKTKCYNYYRIWLEQNTGTGAVVRKWLGLSTREYSVILR